MFGPITPNRPGFAVVYRASGKMQAEVIRGRLESAGIPVLLDYESIGLVYGLTIDGVGEVRIMVPNERVEDAKLLLSEASNEDWDESSSEAP
jgi:Putative prokaryotic signal transducing protein